MDHAGLRDMTKHVLDAWKIDIDNRVKGIDRLPRVGCRVNVHEIEPGVIYTDRNVRITAFPVQHGSLHGIWFSVRDRRQDHRLVRRYGADAEPRRALWRLRCVDPRGLFASDL